MRRYSDFKEGGLRVQRPLRGLQPYGLRAVEGVQLSTFHRGPRKIITVFHQEILLLKKLRKLYSPKGRRGCGGTWVPRYAYDMLNVFARIL